MKLALKNVSTIQYYFLLQLEQMIFKSALSNQLNNERFNYIIHLNIVLQVVLVMHN